MESPRGIFGRLGEKVLGWIALGLLILAGIGLWRIGPEGRGAVWSAIWRTGFWLAVSAALPWLGRLFVGRLLELSTNWAGSALIAVFTLVNVLLGLILIGGLPTGGWGWFAALAALGTAGTYNYLVSEYLAEQAGG